MDFYSKYDCQDSRENYTCSCAKHYKLQANFFNGVQVSVESNLQDKSVVNKGRTYQDGKGPLQRGPILKLLACILGIEDDWGRNTFQPGKNSPPPTDGALKRTLWRREIVEKKMEVE